MSTSYPISALIGEPFTAKNPPFPVGTPVRVEYAFASTRPNDWPELGFSPINEGSVYRTWVDQALANIEAVCGVDYVEVQTASARIVFGLAPISLAGYAKTQYLATRDTYVTHVVYNSDLSSAANARLTIVHEIGHALGLKHPGPYASDDKGPYLLPSEDTTRLTVMSYNKNTPDDLSLAPYDVLALQHMYGPPISAGVRVGLVASGQTRIGGPDDELFYLDDYDWWRSSNKTATFTWRDGAYRFEGDGLTILAGAGIDELLVPFKHSEVSLRPLPEGVLELQTVWQVPLTNGGLGTLSLSNRLLGVERIRFQDGTLALDTQPHDPAGQVYALLYAALDAAPPPGLLGYWIGRSDTGLTRTQLAEEMIATHAPQITATALVELLNYNLVGRPAGPEERSDLVALVDQGVYSLGSLFAAAAALDINVQQYAALVGAGFYYLPEGVV